MHRIDTSFPRRIDYFLMAPRLVPHVSHAYARKFVLGSECAAIVCNMSLVEVRLIGPCSLCSHCPIAIHVNVNEGAS